MAFVSGDGVNPGNTEIGNRSIPISLPMKQIDSGGGGNTLFHNSFSVIFVRTSKRKLKCSGPAV
jgi:hypothetical protein